MSILLPCLGHGALTWENLQIEMTTKSGDKQIEGIFHFRNSGNSPVTITSVKPSCGCTTADLTKQTYAPGESGEIKTVFTLGDRKGRQEKVIQVTTDDAPSHAVALLLRVTIPNLFNYTPRLLMWRRGEELREKPVVVSPISSQRINSIVVKDVSPAVATARIEPSGIGSDYRVFVRPTSTEKTAQITLNCILKLEDGTTLPFKIYALVR